MLRLADPSQEPLIVLIAGPHTTCLLTFLQQRFQVVQHHENALSAQMLEEQIETLLKVYRRLATG